MNKRQYCNNCGAETTETDVAAEFCTQCRSSLVDPLPLRHNSPIEFARGSEQERRGSSMKVVINKCFGGFGLSAQAEDALIGKCPHVELVEPVQYYGGPGSKYYEVNQQRLSPDSWRESYERDLQGSGLTRFHDGKVISDNHREESARSCTALVEIVERLGEAASGRFAKLRIVEIPDGVDFEISEYDGQEHIAEKHRTWS